MPYLSTKTRNLEMSSYSIPMVLDTGIERALTSFKGSILQRPFRYSLPARK